MLCFVFLSRCVALDMIVIPKVSFQPGLVVLACKPSTWNVEVRRSEVQGHSQLE